MRTLLLCVAGLCLAPTGLVRADDEADERLAKIANQKKAGEAAWEAMDVGAGAHVETRHLLVFAPKAMERRIKAVGAGLEKYHDTAAKALALPKDGYPGKITVYLLPERENLRTFILRIEKRRPMGAGTGSFLARDEKLHVVAVPGTEKGQRPVELRAGEMIAGLLLQRKAGVRTELPEWLIAGFARATTYQIPANQKVVASERKQQRRLVVKYKAADAWNGTLEGEEEELLQASVAELFGFGLTTARLTKFLDGFKPGEGKGSKTTAQALEAAGLTAGQINSAWKKFAK